MKKRNNILLPKKYILLIVVIIATLLFAAAHRDCFQSSKDSINHVRSFTKPNNQPNFQLLYNYLFNDGAEEGVDFELYGHQLRFYKTAHITVQNAKITGLTTQRHIQMKEWLNVVDQKLFPWVKPKFSSTLALKESYLGSGIVIYVCDDYVPSAMASIAIIRTHSDIPIEVFYLGSSDLNGESIKLLESNDFVTTKDITQYFDTKLIKIQRHSIKAFAILASTFKKAIWADASTVLLQPPENLLNDPLFLKSGALFFKERNSLAFDTYKSKMANLVIKNLLPRPFTKTVSEMGKNEFLSTNQQDSLLVVVDKERLFTGLMAAAFLNVDKRIDELNKYLDGDKESLWIGFSTVKEQFSWYPLLPGAAGIAEKSTGGYYMVCNLQILHNDRKRNPLWMHSDNFFNLSGPDVKDFLFDLDRMDEKEGLELLSSTDKCLKSKMKPLTFSSSVRELLQKGDRVYKDLDAERTSSKSTRFDQEMTKSTLGGLKRKAKLFDQKDKSPKIDLHQHENMSVADSGVTKETLMENYPQTNNQARSKLSDVPRRLSPWPLWEKIKIEVKKTRNEVNELEEVLHYLKLMKAMKKSALRGGSVKSKEPALLPMQNSLPNNLNLNNLALSVLVLLFALAASMFLSWRNTLTLDIILNSIKSLKDDELSLEVILSTIEAVRIENLRLDP